MTSQVPLWREIQKNNLKSTEQLLKFLQWDKLLVENILQSSSFPLNLPLRLAHKIEKNNIDDPIFKQFVPLKEELHLLSDYLLDPVNDKAFQKERRLLHKYEGRALIVTTGACAMHCRYCFRKNFDYGGSTFSYEKELKVLKEDPTITEVLLSGGDPLSLSNDALLHLLEAIESIEHVKRVRFHTRFPMGIPERIDDSFLAILKKTRLSLWFVIHSNHQNEWDDDIFTAIKKIQLLGIPVLNQSVLLKGINDRVETLVALCEKLIDHAILPYYLHQLDPVQGAKHFEVSKEMGLYLINELQARLPGYGVPKYVQEIPFAKSKIYIHDM